MGRPSNKNIDKKENEVLEQEVEKVDIKTTEVKSTRKRVEIDKNLMVSCRSVVEGILTYTSKRSGFYAEWQNYGDEEFIPVEELITMKATYPVFLTNPWLVIDDEEVVEYLGIKNVYDNMINVDELESMFRLPLLVLEERLKKLPKGFRETVAMRARRMIENESLYDIRIIKLLEKELNINLQILMD